MPGHGKMTVVVPFDFSVSLGRELAGLLGVCRASPD
jgi:hypothetical protein